MNPLITPQFLYLTNNSISIHFYQILYQLSSGQAQLQEFSEFVQNKWRVLLITVRQKTPKIINLFMTFCLVFHKSVNISCFFWIPCMKNIA